MAPLRILALAAGLALSGMAVAPTGASAITNRYTGVQAPGFLGLLFGDDEEFYGAPYGYERPIRRRYRPYGPGPYGYDRPPPPPFVYGGY